MTQALSPASTGASSGAWQNQAGSSANLHQAIDEQPTPDDVDYVWRDNAVIGEYSEYPLSAPTGLPSGEDAVMAWRASDADAAATISLELRQGAAIVAVDSHQLGATETTYQYTLVESEKSAITNWGDLRYRFVVSDPLTISGGSAVTLGDGRVVTL